MASSVIVGRGVGPKGRFGPQILLLVSLLVCAVLLAVPAASAADGCANAAHRAQHGTGHLPDCRAYELVSPNLKANDVVVNTTRFRVTPSEKPGLPMAAIFQSLGGFPVPGLSGSGVAFDYMAQRTLKPGTSGWSTHAITPRQDPLSFMLLSAAAFDPLYVGEPNPDFTRMVHRTVTPLTPAPNLKKMSKLYLREDLRDPDAVSYEFLSDAVSPLNAPFLQTAKMLAHPAGASADLRSVLFESVFPLTADAPPATTAPKLYKSVDGVVQLVGVFPNGDPAPSSIAGQSAGGVDGNAAVTPRVISADGSKVFFTVPEVPGDSNSFTGDLYMRDDRGTADQGDDVTVQINESERDVPDSASPATYWNAAGDGSRVFFTTTEALTNDAPVGNVEMLYVYDTSVSPAESNLTLISVDNQPSDGAMLSVSGVMDVSDDGSTAFFLQRGQIVAGQPDLGQTIGIYAWRAGEGVRYLGRMPEVPDDLNQREVLPERSHRLQDQLGVSVTPDGDFFLVSLRQPPGSGGEDHGDCASPEEKQANVERGCAQLYLYSYDSGDPPVCVSCGPAGASPSTNAFFAAREGNGGAQNSAHRNRPLTDDGSRVFFTTGERLLPGDVNEAFDVYQYDVGSGELHLLSGGTDSSNSYFLDATPSGSDVFIATRDRLSPWDVDRNVDVYDLRAGGGVAAPPDSSEASCEGDRCQAPAGRAPSLPDVGSISFAGDGNLPLTSGPARTSVRVSKLRVVTGSTAILRVHVPGAGRVAVAGRLVRRAGRSVAGPGPHRLRVALKPGAKRLLLKRKRLRTGVRIVFRARGGRSASKTIRIAFKRPNHKAARAGRGGR